MAGKRFSKLPSLLKGRFMKNFFLLLSLLIAGTAFAGTECKLNLVPVGIYYTSCPRGTLVDGVDAYHPGPSPYPMVRVRCLEPRLECKEVLKEEASDIEEGLNALASQIKKSDKRITCYQGVPGGCEFKNKE